MRDDAPRCDHPVPRASSWSCSANAVTLDRIALAARNNAEWCDAVTRSSGGRCAFDDSVWINSGPAPPYYPNAVMLTPSNAVPPAIAAATGDFSVKDSFNILDLAPLGFTPLFDATWIWRDPLPVQGSDEASWRIIRDAASLARWAAACFGDEPASDVFRPGLLAESDHAFIVGEIRGEFAAGCVASPSETVVGVSNLFGDARLWPGCIRAALDFAPGLPLVGYDRGGALEVMKSLGFQALGPLRVWQREA